MKLFSWERFLMFPVVGIIRDIPMESVIQILPRLQQAGFTAIEITMNTPNVEGIIRYALRVHEDQLNIGPRTVCTLDDFEKARAAGSQFIVTPVIDERIINNCVQGELPIFPGAYTPSEIYKAWKLGASMVKVFPAGALGPSYVKELRGPLKQIKLLPTGGINLHNCIEFLNAGASGLGIGNELFDREIIKKRNWQGLFSHFKIFFEKIDTKKHFKKR